MQFTSKLLYVPQTVKISFSCTLMFIRFLFYAHLIILSNSNASFLQVVTLVRDLSYPSDSMEKIAKTSIGVQEY